MFYTYKGSQTLYPTKELAQEAAEEYALKLERSQRLALVKKLAVIIPEDYSDPYSSSLLDVLDFSLKDLILFIEEHKKEVPQLITLAEVNML